MKAYAHLFLFSFLVYFAACVEEQLSVEENQQIASAKMYPNVDPALWSHFRAFEDAAAERGFTVDLARTNIVGTIEDIPQDNIAGTCAYGGNQFHKDVTIDKTFWDRASHLYREYIVFHELGHCFLFRDHYEACFDDNTYVSIMRSGNGNCRDNYRLRTRDYYIDELLTPLERP